MVIVQDPRAARPNLFSDGQNMYHLVVLVCTVNVYIPASLCRRPILRYQVCKKFTHFTYSLKTDSCVGCREYCKQFDINAARHLLSAVFIARHFNIERKKPNLTYSLRLYFYLTQPHEDNWIATLEVADLIKKVDIIRLDGA